MYIAAKVTMRFLIIPLETVAKYKHAIEYTLLNMQMVLSGLVLLCIYHQVEWNFGESSGCFTGTGVIGWLPIHQRSILKKKDWFSKWFSMIYLTSDWYFTGTGIWYQFGFTQLTRVAKVSGYRGITRASCRAWSHRPIFSTACLG